MCRIVVHLCLPKRLPSWKVVIQTRFQVWYMRFGTGSEPLIGITFWSLIALVGASAFAFGVVVGLTGLLYFQLKGIWKNRTGIEDYIGMRSSSSFICASFRPESPRKT